MIRGDVDLTRHLDFYHDKPKKTIHKKMLPWKCGNGETGLCLKYGTYRVDSNTAYNLSWSTLNDTYTYLHLYNSTNVDAGLITYNLNSNSQCVISYGGDATYTTYDIIDHWIYDYTSNQDVYYIKDPDPKDHFIYADDEYGIRRDRKFQNLYSRHPKVDKDAVFAGKSTALRYCHMCHKWHIGRVKKCRYQDDPRDIPWRKSKHPNFRKYRKFVMTGSDKIPWYNEHPLVLYDIQKKYRKEEDEEGPQKKRDGRIPWLNHLDHRIYTDYIKDLDEEQDYSKYLTDMGWIHVH